MFGQSDTGSGTTEKTTDNGKTAQGVGLRCGLVGGSSSWGHEISGGKLVGRGGSRSRVGRSCTLLSNLRIGLGLLLFGLLLQGCLLVRFFLCAVLVKTIHQLRGFLDSLVNTVQVMGNLERLTNNQIANRTSEAKRLTGGWLITLGGHRESEDRKDEENREE